MGASPQAGSLCSCARCDNNPGDFDVWLTEIERCPARLEAKQSHTKAAHFAAPLFVDLTSTFAQFREDFQENLHH
jgi:hypothetical protein